MRKVVYHTQNVYLPHKKLSHAQVCRVIYMCLVIKYMQPTMSKISDMLHPTIMKVAKCHNHSALAVTYMVSAG